MLEALFEKYQDRGLMVITLLTGSDTDEVAQWVDEFGSTHPVLADTEYIASRWEQDGGIPSHHLLAPGAVIEIIDGNVTEDDIVALLPE